MMVCDGASRICIYSRPLYAIFMISTVAVVMLAGIEDARAEQVFLYDSRSATTKVFNDITIWKTSAEAQSANSRLSTSVTKAACLAKAGTAVERLSTLGKAVEVRRGFSCVGFVNAAFVHDKK